MEVLKKTILQAVTTGITACTGTTGTCYVIIPDLSVTYHLKIGLVQETIDLGFFDVFGDGYYYGEIDNGFKVTYPPIGLNNLL
jgi:hypothetical protein